MGDGWRRGASGALVVAALAVTACSSSAAPVLVTAAGSSPTSAAGSTGSTIAAGSTSQPGSTASTGSVSASTSAPTTPVTVPPPSGPTQLDGILAQVGPDGTLPVAAARQLFQLAYGGLDGVQVPTGASDPVVYGTFALAAMDQHRSELTAAEAATLDSVIAAGAPVSATVPPQGATSGLRRSSSLQHPAAATCSTTKDDQPFGVPLGNSEPDVADFSLRIAHWEQVIGGQLGTPLGIPVDIAVFAANGPVAKSGKAAVADTWSFDDQCAGGRPSRCRVRFFAGARLEDETDRDDTAAHELWHCFEAMAVGSRDQAFREPDWVVEGEATWVAAKVTGSISSSWIHYLRSSGTDLFARAYDALGYYGSLESDGAPMFPTLVQILEAGVVSGSAAYHALLAAAPTLPDNVASMFFLDQSALDWHYRTTTGQPPPYLPGQKIPDASDLDVGQGISKDLTVGPRAALLVRIHPTSDFVHVVASAHASMLDEAGTETHEVTDTWLCTHDDPKRCQCPEDTKGQTPESTYASGEVRFAEGADDHAGTATISGFSLDDFCKHEDKYCADVKRLADIEIRDYTAIQSGSVNPASQPFLERAITDRVTVLHDMSHDAPADIAVHVKPYEAGYDQYAAAFASGGYVVSNVPRAAADAGVHALAEATTAHLPTIIADAKSRCDVVIPQATP